MLGDGGLHHGSLQLVEDVVMVLPLLGSLYQLVELVLKALPANLDRFDGKLKIIENQVLVKNDSLQHLTLSPLFELDVNCRVKCPSSSKCL